MSEVYHVVSTPLAEEFIVKMARVSNPANQDNMETAPRLIKYLIDHKHWSPFEMANMVLEINTTRAISAQICRHRSFTFQEFSQRYASTKRLSRIEQPQLRSQDLKNRQNSIDDTKQRLGKPKLADLNFKISQLFEQTEQLAQELEDAGIAKECIRMIQPMGSPTKIYMNGTLRSWIHYIQLRTSSGTQLEHRVIAAAAQDIFCDQFPLIAKALGWYVTTDQELLDQLMHTHQAQPKSQSSQGVH